MTMLIEEDLDVTIKVIAVGNGSVGKTSLISRFARGLFTGEYKKTLGVDFLEKRYFVASQSEEVSFFLWDTAGQEEYDAVTRGYYKGAAAAIVVFSTTDRKSFDSVESWYKKVQEECGPIYSVLVQNKVDLINESKVSSKEVEELATRLKMKLFRASVKDGLNVTDVFEDLGSEYLKNRKDFQKIERPSPQSIESSSGKVILGQAKSKDINREAKPRYHTPFTNCNII